MIFDTSTIIFDTTIAGSKNVSYLCGAFRVVGNAEVRPMSVIGQRFGRTSRMGGVPHLGNPLIFQTRIGSMINCHFWLTSSNTSLVNTVKKPIEVQTCSKIILLWFVTFIIVTP